MSSEPIPLALLVGEDGDDVEDAGDKEVRAQEGRYDDRCGARRSQQKCAEDEHSRCFDEDEPPRHGRLV